MGRKQRGKEQTRSEWDFGSRDLSAENGMPANMHKTWDDPTFFGKGCRPKVKPIDGNAILSLTAANACIKVKSKMIASLPIKLYQRTPAGRVQADLPQWRLIAKEPHPSYGPTLWMERYIQAMDIGGAGVAIITRDLRYDTYGNIVGGTGLPTKLTLVPLGCVQVGYDKQGIRTFSIHGKTYGEQDVLYVPFEEDAWTGKPIAPWLKVKDVFGMAMAADTFLESWFRNGVSPTAIITSNLNFADKTKKDSLKSEIAASYQGSLNAGLPWVKGPDTTIDFGQSPSALNIHEHRKKFVQEIAATFGVPLSYLMIPGQTYENTEQQGIIFVRMMADYFCKIEEELNRKLLREDQKEEYYFEFDKRALLSGNQEAIDKSLTAGRLGGWYSKNDCRRVLNMPSIGPEGDVYGAPLASNAAQLEAKPPVEAKRSLEPIEAALLDYVIREEAERRGLKVPTVQDQEQTREAVPAIEAPASFVAKITEGPDCFEHQGGNELAAVHPIPTQNPPPRAEETPAVEQDAPQPGKATAEEPSEQTAERSEAILSETRGLPEAVQAEAVEAETVPLLDAVLAREERRIGKALDSAWGKLKAEKRSSEDLLPWFDERKANEVEKLRQYLGDKAEAFIDEKQKELEKTVCTGSIADLIQAWRGHE